MEHEKLVSFYAWKVIRRCPLLELDDVKQELTIHALAAAETFDPTTKLEFVNYLGRKLRWRAFDLVRKHIRQVKAESRWASEVAPSSAVPATEQSYATLCQAVVTTLARKAAKTRNQKARLGHAQDLFAVLAGQGLVAADQAAPIPTDLAHAAQYLGLGYVSKYRALAEIKKVVEKVINRS
jgi:DNA-directed RNA polymerase specialized sigma24 family protein